MMTSDEEIIEKVCAGDKDAFGTLIERHQKAVIGFLISLLHDLDAAEDVAQQAFIKAFKNLGSFERRANFRTWVSRIAINEARSRQRWAGFRRWLSLDAPQGGENVRWEERVRDMRPKSDEKETLEKKIALEQALEALSPREREIAAMRLEGYELSEIAQSLGVSVGTAKSTLFTATRKMRTQLS